MSLEPALRRQLSTPPIALGGAPLGNLYRRLDDVDARSVVAHAYAIGVRYFDTAPHYGQGLSERRMGDALRALPPDYRVSTKVGRLLSADVHAPRDQHGYVAALPFTQRFDYSADAVRRSIDDSLQRLGLAHIDLAYVHDIDAATHGAAFPARYREVLDGALPALARLKAEGVIGGYGLGVNVVDICIDTLARADLDVILLAGRYTLADQSAHGRLLPECLRRNVAVVLGGPFNSGILATGSAPADGGIPTFDYRPATSEMIARVAAIERVCNVHRVSLAAAALQFPCGHPAVACVLAGARSTTEIAANVGAMRVPIPPAFWTALRDAGLISADIPLPRGAA